MNHHQQLLYSQANSIDQHAPANSNHNFNSFDHRGSQQQYQMDNVRSSKWGAEAMGGVANGNNLAENVLMVKYGGGAPPRDDSSMHR